jgi:hypothetical protein
MRLRRRVRALAFGELWGLALTPLFRVSINFKTNERTLLNRSLISRIRLNCPNAKPLRGMCMLIPTYAFSSFKDFLNILCVVFWPKNGGC